MGKAGQRLARSGTFSTVCICDTRKDHNGRSIFPSTRSDLTSLSVRREVGHISPGMKTTTRGATVSSRSTSTSRRATMTWQCRVSALSGSRRSVMRDGSRPRWRSFCMACRLSGCKRLASFPRINLRYNETNSLVNSGPYTAIRSYRLLRRLIGREAHQCFVQLVGETTQSVASSAQPAERTSTLSLRLYPEAMTISSPRLTQDLTTSLQGTVNTFSRTRLPTQPNNESQSRGKF